MKCQSYQYSRCFDDNARGRCSRRLGLAYALLDDTR
jgi:hypothetical protein